MELLAEVRLVVGPNDHPAVTLDSTGEELVIFPGGGGEVTILIPPEDAKRWLRELESAIAATVAKALGRDFEG